MVRSAFTLLLILPSVLFGRTYKIQYRCGESDAEQVREIIDLRLDVLEAIVVDEFDDDFEGVHSQSIRFKARDDLFGLICRLFHFHGSLSLVPVIPVGEAVPEIETSPEVQVVPDEVEDCWFIVGEGYMLVRDDVVWHTYQKAVSEEEPVKGPFYLVEFEEALGLDGKIVDFNLVDDTPEFYITVNLHDEYAQELEDLTRGILGRRLALIIDDDEVVTTIAFNEVIENGQFEIEFMREDIGTLLLVWLSGDPLPESYRLATVSSG